MATGTTDFIEDACDALEKNEESYIVVCWSGDSLRSYAGIDPAHRPTARRMLMDREWQDILLHHLMSLDTDD